ncbi:MAG: FkbM family methyltransferase [Acidobacteriota bacterium]
MLRELRKHVEVFGTTGWFYAAVSRIARLLHFEMRVRVRVPAYPSRRVELRLGTSDLEVFREVFCLGEFDIEPPEPPRYIIDAGANAGFSTLYFALKYPEARIVAIELEPSNFRQLLRNVEEMANVNPLQAGLWGSPVALRIVDPRKGKWAFSAAVATGAEDASAQGTVRAVTVGEVMALMATSRIGILKLDIEGGERDVLQSSADWIDKVDCLIIELHDRLVDGCSTAFENAIRGLCVDRQRRGEKIIVRNRTMARPIL